MGTWDSHCARGRAGRNASLLLFAVALLAGCSGHDGKSVENLEGEPPSGLRTEAPATVRAGERLALDCVPVDAAGAEVTATGSSGGPSYTFDPPDAVRVDDSGVTALRAGRLQVRCALSELGPLSATPAEVTVLAGPATELLLTAEPTEVQAGQSVALSCVGMDAYGNPLDIAGADVQVHATPEVPGTEVSADSARFERAGDYALTCRSGDAQSTPLSLTVTPGLPATVSLEVAPRGRTLGGIGRWFSTIATVHDRYGNPVPYARVTYSAEPPADVSAPQRMRFDRDGRYLVTATVTPPNDGEGPLVATGEAVVDTTGPALPCDPDLDNGLLTEAPGASLTFRSRVTDLTGIAELRVQGQTVPVADDGSYAFDLNVEHGLHLLSLSATDTLGQTSTGLCAFVASEVWAPLQGPLPDTLSLRFDPTFFDDDGVRPTVSLADLLHATVPRLVARIDEAALARNPIVPRKCYQDSAVGCLLRARVNYISSSLDGEHSISLALVDGGLAFAVELQDLSLRLRVDGTAAGIGYDTTGTVRYSSVRIDTVADLSIVDGKLVASTRPGSTRVDASGARTDFSGLAGDVLDSVIVPLVGSSTFNRMLEDALSDAVEQDLGGALSNVLDGIGLSALEGMAELPRLDGGDPITLRVGTVLSSLSVTKQRMLLGLGSAFDVAPVIERRTRFAPVRGGTRLRDVGGPDALGAAMHEGLLAQGAHALWRAGLLDVTFGAAQFDVGLPDGVSATLTPRLPPVVHIEGDRAHIALGGVELSVAGLGPAPIEAILGARVSLAIALNGGAIAFEDFRVDDLQLSADLRDLGQLAEDDNAGVELLLAASLEEQVRAVLDAAAPSAPLPEVVLPASVRAYGLPAGATLGVKVPRMGVAAPHVDLHGDVGFR